MPRHYRRRSMGMRPVIQSQKVVLNYAPTSRAATSVLTSNLSKGIDAVAAGQSGPTDPNVPTGSIIKYFEIQWSVTNLINVSQFFWISIQRRHSGQPQVSPRLVGGHPQRNQVFYQKQFMLGQSQNSNHIIRFKVPKKYQRVRDGDLWDFIWESDQVHTEALQVIYKYYR